MNDLKGKVVVITGGSSGIGLAIIKQLLNTEIKFLAVFELDTKVSRTVLENLETVYGSKIKFYPCDVSKADQVDESFESVFQMHNTIDIFINNAGISSEKYAELMIDVNYKAVVLNSLKVIKRIGKHKGGKGGIIVNIASTLGLTNAFFPIYSSTKHGVVSFTRLLQQYFETTGVRAIAICPGLTDTVLVQDSKHCLEFVDVPLRYMDDLAKQSPDNVAIALLQLLQEGRVGVWVVDNDEPAFEVAEKWEIDPNCIARKSNL